MTYNVLSGTLCLYTTITTAGGLVMISVCVACSSIVSTIYVLRASVGATVIGQR